MKFLEKLGLVINSTVVLVLSLVLILMGFDVISPNVITNIIVKILYYTSNGKYILIGVCAVLILLAIRCLFFSNLEKEKYSGIEMENDDGKLLITEDTLEDIVDGVVKNFPSIVSADPEVEIDSENNVSINVDINVREGAVIKEITSKLQNDIKKAIKNGTDLELKDVNITVKELKPDEKDEEEKNQDWYNKKRGL